MKNAASKILGDIWSVSSSVEILMKWFYVDYIHVPCMPIMLGTLRSSLEDEKDTFLYPQSLFPPLNNCGSLIAWTEFPFIKDLELT